MSTWHDDIELRQPKKVAPTSSWWAEPELQTDREKFAAWAKSEQERIVGNQRFGGSRKVIDKFPSSQKKSQR